MGKELRKKVNQTIKYNMVFKMKGSPFADKNKDKKKAEVTTTYDKDGGFTKSDGKTSQKYTLNPDYKKDSPRTGNYKYITGAKNPDGSPVGTNN